ncbi:MAG TPA: hypothetical protein VKF83_09145 [Stellaceae bacterium]|nr:hypothetical protein [Stellaceae bacterium]
MLFESKARRHAKKTSEFVEFFRSAEGRRAIFELAPDILVSSKLAPILNDVRVQFEVLTAREMERFKLLLERILKTEESCFSYEIDKFKGHLAKSLKVAEDNFADTLKAAENHFTNFLCSKQGKRLMLDLLIEALARGELTPVLDGAEDRLKVLAEEAIATHTAHAELSLKQSAEAHAEAFKSSASEAARDLANQVAHDVQRRLSSYRGTIVEVVKEQLPVALREAVAAHVRSGPLFSPPCSNRALATAHGISIREVKRRRRSGYF